MRGSGRRGRYFTDFRRSADQSWPADGGCGGALWSEIYSGFDGEAPERLSGNLILDQFLEADLRFVADRHKRTYVEEIIAEYEEAGHKVFVIPMGGSNALGTLGYVLMMVELAEQIKTSGITPTHLFVAAGSGGTLAGIALGAKLVGLDQLQIRGIPVIPAENINLPERTLQFIQQAAELLGRNDIIASEQDFVLDYGPATEPYTGLGYNIPDDKTICSENICHYGSNFSRALLYR